MAKSKQPAKQQKNKTPFTEEQRKILRDRYGFPNWREEKKYEYVRKLSNNQLFWEFLRRDPWYRRLWENHKKIDPIKQIGSGIVYMGVDELIPPYVCGADMPKDMPTFATAGRGMPIHPLMDTPNIIYDQSDEELAEICLRLGCDLLELYDTEQVIIGFDPFLPIKPQIATATRVLKNIQKSKKLKKKPNMRSASPKHVKLLRVLDAHEEGTAHIEIGKVVYGKEYYADANSEVSNRIKEAKKYRQWL